MEVLHKKIVLASASPRRRDLLEKAGFQFEVRPTDIPEDYPEELPVEEVAEYLAIKKAEAARSSLQQGEIALAADSVVILDGVIYGKPVDYEDAFRIISKLSGRVHDVFTGVCLLSSEKKVSFSSLSKVHIGELSPAEIDYYIQKFQPYDKAGAYAIQEWIGLCKIHKIEGTHTNIMGLPVDRVYAELLAF
ncbi:MAG TPA: Maf family nucleotide pyrophosphatase [Saprospiraceae bacterium]|nr:Maf family nucleotide pyrophosphatase [Saprospiraceae bacterium]HMQ85668.1 Maf family nucleotide pyrophosphatase [Saprospiraceae bacterium]